MRALFSVPHFAQTTKTWDRRPEKDEASSDDRLRSPVKPHKVGENLDGGKSLLQKSPARTEVAAVHSQLRVAVRHLFLTVGAAVLVIDEVELARAMKSTGSGDLLQQEVTIASVARARKAFCSPGNPDDIGPILIELLFREECGEWFIEAEVHTEDDARSTAVCGHFIPSLPVEKQTQSPPRWPGFALLPERRRMLPATGAPLMATGHTTIPFPLEMQR